MRQIKKINAFYVSFALSFIYFTIRQFNSILHINVFNGIELNSNILFHSIIIIFSVVLLVVAVYIIPLLLIVHIVTVCPIHLNEIKISIPIYPIVYQYTVRSINRNRLYCVVRC